MIDVLNEIRIVQQECRQVRTQVENVFPTAATTRAWEQSLAEITSRQDALTTRIRQIETHTSVIAQDQNSAADSNQGLWRNATSRKTP